jgi:hypothetical protein
MGYSREMSSDVYRRKEQWHPHYKPVQTLKWHWPHPSDPNLSACGKVNLEGGDRRSAKETLIEARCQLNGCRRKW